MMENTFAGEPAISASAANSTSSSDQQSQSSGQPRKLHIGGKVRSPGWEVLNAVPAPYVDHVGNANDLSQFADCTFTDIYASHLVEHLDYKQELVATLQEWHRVLVPGGKVYISVPDLDVLAKLFIDKEKLSFPERFMVMRMIFGGHVDKYDYHLVGLNQEFLTMYLVQAGYGDVQRVQKFGFFEDTSNMVFKGVPISVNLVASKPVETIQLPNSLFTPQTDFIKPIKTVDDLYAVPIQESVSVNELLKMAENLGAQGRTEAAIAYYRQVLSIDATSFPALVNLGNLLKEQGNYGEALSYYRKALAVNPKHPAVENNLACILKDQGLIDEAVDYFYQAVKNNPNFPLTYSNLLLTLNYSAAHESSAVYAEHVRWAEHYAAPLLKEIQPYHNEVDPDRQLRIGYVSSNFSTHSVAFFYEPLLSTHHRSDFKITCYANGRRVDATTQRLQNLADDWRDIYALEDAQVAELIRQDRIDILVDLSGHTSGHRMLVFARKPAPIQVSYLGYPNTTGLATMDYRLTDGWADPEGCTEALHTEQLVRLPHGFLCYQPTADCPEVAPLPVLKTGYITFGSFNNLAKVSPQLVAYWAAILAAVPQSRMLIKSRPLADPDTQNYVRGLFEQCGIGGDRLELLGLIPARRDHLALYNQVDIALDTFPYNGTTTTCEAMWMGVPVITLAGQTHGSRVGVSLLSVLGLPELITASPEDYIQTAIALAENRQRLQWLRENLRERMQTAPLSNPPLITASVEAAYRMMWHRWCETRLAESLA